MKSSHHILISVTLLALMSCNYNAQPTPSPTPGSSQPAARGTVVSVPLGEPPIIDGELSQGEWEAARVEAFADGSELLLLHNDGSLYLAIRASSPGMIAGNVFLARDGEIEILHASAALGAARYQQDGAFWEQVQEFNWCCRSTGLGDAASAELSTLLQEQGWTAVNSRVGAPNELEYRIEQRAVPFQLAVNFLRASEPDRKIPWPVGLQDDVILPTPGGLPERFDFSLDHWATLEF